MSEKKTIAVVGQGFVGGALTTVMSRTYDVFAYDKANQYARGVTKSIKVPGVLCDPHRHPRSVQELVAACEAQETFTGVYFVCLPTPMKPSGECDVSIVEGVLRELANAPYDPASPHVVRDDTGRIERIAVVKSTVPPGTVALWNAMFGQRPGFPPRLHVVFQPEFLTEANALRDFENQDRIIVGGERPWSTKVAQLFAAAFPGVPIIKTSSTTAEMVKYFTNVQLAARVILSCELAEVCSALDQAGLDIDYDKVKEYASYDKRLGGTHMSVPGSDGVAGARGHCFPKDLRGITHLARQLGVEPTVMDALWKKNCAVVPPEHRDWERMKGRAVSA